MKRIRSLLKKIKGEQRVINKLVNQLEERLSDIYSELTRARNAEVIATLYRRAGVYVQRKRQFLRHYEMLEDQKLNLTLCKTHLENQQAMLRAEREGRRALRRLRATFTDADIQGSHNATTNTIHNTYHDVGFAGGDLYEVPG